MYSVDSTFAGHAASINALAFSPDGRYLASGADDGFIFIWEVLGGREAHKLDGKTPVTALLWSGELYAGFADGRVASAEVTPDELTAAYIPRAGGGVVEHISTDHSALRLAICVGPEVEIWTRIRSHKMGRRLLPSPFKAGGRPRVSMNRNASIASEQAHTDAGHGFKPRSSHFVKTGNRLLVGYLDDGIYCWDFQTQTYVWHIATRVGRLTLTPDEKFIAVSNLYDGFDLYKMSDRSWVRTFPVDTRLNVPLPVLVVEGGVRLFMGSSCGQVSLVDLHTGHTIQILGHDGNDVIQAIASHSDDAGTCLLATGSSERGVDTLVRVWRLHTRTRKVDVAVETEPSLEIVRPSTAAAPKLLGAFGLVAFIASLLSLSIIFYRHRQTGQTSAALQAGRHKSNPVQELVNSVHNVVASISVWAARSMAAPLNRYVAYMQAQ